MSVFIYHPKSGDRVFAQSPPTLQPDLLSRYAGPAWVQWPNGCRHVLGGVHLSFAAAVPGRWYRDDAKALAASVVDSGGGIAWDEQGMVNLIIPVRHAWDAWELMSQPGKPEHRWTDTGNLSRLVIAGAAVIGRNDASDRPWPWYYRGYVFPATWERRLVFEALGENDGFSVYLQSVLGIEERSEDGEVINVRLPEPDEETCWGPEDSATAPWGEPSLWQ